MADLWAWDAGRSPRSGAIDHAAGSASPAAGPGKGGAGDAPAHDDATRGEEDGFASTLQLVRVPEPDEERIASILAMHRPPTFGEQAMRGVISGLAVVVVALLVWYVWIAS